MVTILKFKVYVGNQVTTVRLPVRLLLALSEFNDFRLKLINNFNNHIN